MSQLLTIRLARSEANCPWGFRLQGGKDFGTPLLIQKVNMGSLAERAGLQVGDAVVRVNGQELYEQRHKDAQDAIVRAGNCVEITVQRGGNTTWKPSVTPVGSAIPSPNPFASGCPSPVTKTSLAANRQTTASPAAIGTGYNNISKPFSPQMNGGHSNENGCVKAIVNKQYNTPVGIYSDESIAETLSAQAEVLAGGVLGVNFKKNEKNYNAGSSEVFKMVQLADKEPKSPEPDASQNQNDSGVVIPPPVSGLRHVSAPQTKPHSAPQTQLPPGKNICADCDRLIVPSSACYFATSSHAIGGRATSPRPQSPIAPAARLPPRSVTNSPAPLQSLVKDSPQCADCRQVIVGVFVRIKDKNLHVECFKCATCGTSLKNVGYYNINNKLYCDIHAKMIAKQNPPSPNLEPILIPPSPFGAAKNISSALSNNRVASPMSMSPQPYGSSAPFQIPRQSPTYAPTPTPQNFSNNANCTKSFLAPKPINNSYAQTSKLETNSQSCLVSISDSYQSSFSYTGASSSLTCGQKRFPFLKPRDDKISAFQAVVKSSPGCQNQTPSCSASQRSAEEKGWGECAKLETVFENRPDQETAKVAGDGNKRPSLCSREVTKVLESSPARRLKAGESDGNRPESPVPSDAGDDFTSAHRRSEDNCENSSLSEMECITKPLAARLDLMDRPRSVRSISPMERPCTPTQVVVFPPQMPDFSDKSLLKIGKSQKFETMGEPVRGQNIKICGASCGDGCECVKECTRETIRVKCRSPFPPSTIQEITEGNFEPENSSLKNLPRIRDEPGGMTAAMTIAPTRPFTPVEPVPPIITTKPVPLPPETKPYLPSLGKSQGGQCGGKEQPERSRSPMLTALTIASERSYSPLPTDPIFQEESKEEKKVVEKEKRLTMLEALATAPSRSYSSLRESHEFESVETNEKLPELTDPSVILTSSKTDFKGMDVKGSEKSARTTNKSCTSSKSSTTTFDSVKASSRAENSFIASSAFYLNEGEKFKVFEPVSNELKSKFERKCRETPQEKEAEAGTGVHRSRFPFTPTGLHKAATIPHYQQCVDEMIAKNTTPSSSRHNTPTPSKRKTPTPHKRTSTPSKGKAGTPANFEAIVSTQQKVFHSDTAQNASSIQASSVQTASSTYEKIVKTEFSSRSSSAVMERNVVTSGSSEMKSASLKSSAASFLTSFPKGDHADKVTPALGYKPTALTETKTYFDKGAQRETSGCAATVKKTLTEKEERVKKETSNTTQKNVSVVDTSTSTQLKPSSSPVNFCPSSLLVSQGLTRTLTALASGKKQLPNLNPARSPNKPLSSSSIPKPTGSCGTGASRGSSSAGLSAPRRGRGVLNQQNLTPGARIPLCAQCSSQIRGPFVTALGKIWCPDHFLCVNTKCRRSLMDIGFVEEPSGLYCEYCFEQYLAPSCDKCSRKIKGDCLNAIGKHYHPECFVCAYCSKLFRNSPFFLEDGLPYCENDWNELFTTKCFACGFPIEAGDRWVEALNNNYHSPCFNCTMCKTNLEGQSFYAKGGRPFCKTHAR